MTATLGPLYEVGWTPSGLQRRLRNLDDRDHEDGKAFVVESVMALVDRSHTILFQYFDSFASAPPMCVGTANVRQRRQ